MAMNINVQGIIQATCTSHNAGKFHVAFDAVKIFDKSGSSVCLFLPSGKGHAVAAAINAAISEVMQ